MCVAARVHDMVRVIMAVAIIPSLRNFVGSWVAITFAGDAAGLHASSVPVNLHSHCCSGNRFSNQAHLTPAGHSAHHGRHGQRGRGTQTAGDWVSFLRLLGGGGGLSSLCWMQPQSITVPHGNESSCWSA